MKTKLNRFLAVILSVVTALSVVLFASCDIKIRDDSSSSSLVPGSSSAGDSSSAGGGDSSSSTGGDSSSSTGGDSSSSTGGDSSSSTGGDSSSVEVTLKEITLDISAAKIFYEAGETFTAEGLIVTAKMSDNTTKTIEIAECELSAPDMNVEGEKKVTVTYMGKSAEFTITVKKTLIYNVYFNAMGGSAVSPVGSDGKTIELPTAPTRENFSFVGWYYDRALTKAFDKDSLATKPLEADVTLYAKWAQSAKVTYVFEAEDADVSGKVKFEYPEAKFASIVSKVRYMTFAEMSNGATVTLKVTSEKATAATLGIVNNKPDDFTFEKVFTLSVNGEAVTVGAVKGNGWGGNTYANFGGSCDVNVNLKAGENVIVLTLVDKGLKEANLDCFKITTTDSEVKLAKGSVFDFEAEDAVLPEGVMIETPTAGELNYAPASGGKSVGALNKAGDKVVFNISSDDAGKAILGIDMNRPDPLNFEDKFILRVNGKQISIGSLTVGYWTGLTPYYCFAHLVETEIDLVKGENVIELEVVGGANLDKITFFTDLFLEWTKNEQVAL